MDHNFYIKTNRAFTFVRSYAWLITLMVAFGGLWIPKLGLIVLPIMAGLTATSFFKGRYWCGNFCPHGSLFDNIYLKLSQNKAFIWLFKHKAAKFIFFGWFAFNISKRIFKSMMAFGTADFLDKLGFVFVMTYLMVMVLSLILSVANNSRTWCNICPMGTIQTFSYRLGKLLKVNRKTDGKVTIADKSMCHTCGKCTRVCPMQLEVHTNFNDDNQFADEKCLRCATCVNNCPAGILEIKPIVHAIPQIQIDPKFGYENRQKVMSKLESIVDLGGDVREFTFRFMKPDRLHYKAGQFILVKISETPVMYRAYSIASHYPAEETLKVIIKKAPNGYGTGIIWDNFKENMEVELEGPMGGELILDKSAKNVLFVANGVGITPFIPLVEDALKDDSSIENVTLVVGARSESDMIYDEYFSEKMEKDTRFKYLRVASRPESKDTFKGYVGDAIKKMDLADHKIYMCGSKPMIEGTRDILLDMEIPEENIYYESA